MLRKLYSILFSLSGILTFAQAPTATINVANDTVCSGNAILFLSLTTNTPTAYSWSVSPSAGFNFVTPADQPTTLINFSHAGVYSVSLTVSNVSGTVTTSVVELVLVTPVAAFSASLNTAGFPSQINLTNFSSNATNYIWSFSETVSTNTTTNAVHSYTAGGAYTVTLLAINNNGCTDSDSYSFYISDSSGITLPNIFTPNDDGVNDIFKPTARGISTMKVDIYSRWGNYMYGWTTPNGFWDGHTVSGEACVSGVYFYVLEATGFDGKSYKLHSSLTLIRNQ